MPDASSEETKQPRQTARYQPLVIVLVAVCVGILADRAWGVPVTVWSGAVGLAWLGWAALWWRGWDRTAGLGLLASVAACGGLWHHVQWNLFAPNDLGCFARRERQPVCVEAIALEAPQRVPAREFNPMRIIPSFDQTRVELVATGVRDGTRWRHASGRVRLTVEGHLLGIRAGDRLRVFGQLSATRRPQNPGDFDSAAHHRTRRRLSQLGSDYPECVSVARRGHPLSPRRWIENARTAGRQLLRKHLDDRQAALAATVLLGAREEVTDKRVQAFMETGTVHLLAISGLHVGIIAGALFLGLRLVFAPRRQAVVCVAVATVLYALLTDARPPAIRATILVLTFCASTYLGRPRLTFNSLAAAALVVLALNPADLFRTGVHLSFLAVAGLMWWFARPRRRDPIDRLLAKNRAWPWRVLVTLWRWTRQLTLAGLVIWLLAQPLVMARFHLFSPVAPLLNTLLWLPMAFALVSGFGVLLFGWILPPLAALFGACCGGSLWLLESSVRTARDVPCSHFWVPGPPEWWLVGFYGGVALLAAFPAIRLPRRWCAALLAGWIAAGLIPSTLRSHAGRLECLSLSVGHGCATLLELPSGQTMLYDAGCLASPEIGARSVAASLWSRGITHLDAVILSHADADHYNLLPDLLERFSVGVVYVSPLMFEYESGSLVALREAIREADVPLREILAGDRLRGGEGCRIEVLHPRRRGVIGKDNANSIVLAVEHCGRRILLPGDLESPGLDDVLAEAPWDCDVLLAPHHGSRNSNPPGLAAWCRPDWVIISGSLDSRHPETTETYRAVGAQVLVTGEIGAIRCVIDAAGQRTDGFLGATD